MADQKVGLLAGLGDSCPDDYHPSDFQHMAQTGENAYEVVYAESLSCLECDAMFVGTAVAAYESGWRLFITRYRRGQLCPVHAKRWLKKNRKRVER